jgi:hypothetical protein
MGAAQHRLLTPKHPYHPPRLTRYGELRDLTQAKGGSSNDGGSKPRTRSSGKTT